MNEANFATRVEGALDAFGWKWMHPRPARVLRHGKETYETAYSGHKGFLDYLAVKTFPDGRCVLVIFEIKGDGGRLTPEQDEWISALAKSGAVVGVFWPRDWAALEYLLREGE